MVYYGFFKKRINRFVVELNLNAPDGDICRVYMPNPGRLWELLFPQSKLLLKRNKPGGKYRYTVEGVYKEDQLVFLHTLKNNDLAEYLLKNKLIPKLEGHEIIKREAVSPLGGSRFDFLLQKDGIPCYLEVKCCSLFQGQMAMFPDAPSIRATKHLLELQELKEQGYRCEVLIIVQNDLTDFFLPEYHTDLQFAETMLACKKDITFHVVGTKIHEDLTYSNRVKPMKIPWEILKNETIQRGAALMLIEIENSEQKSVELKYKPGFYLHISYHERDLDKELNRLGRKRKTSSNAWDRIRMHGTNLKSICIRGSHIDFPHILQDFKHLSDEAFSPREDTLGEIFYHRQNPLHNKEWVERLFYYRMEAPIKNRVKTKN